MYYGDNEKEGEQSVGTIHSHSPDTGDFITATDICTLMLYENFAKWKTHQVVSEKYLNIWNCETNELLVITLEASKKIDKHQKKQKRSAGKRLLDISK